MSSLPYPQPISIRDYLTGEQSAKRKHEFVDGVVYAMVGATNAHNRIATNATGILHSQLRGRPCQVFNSDTKIRVRQSRGTRFYYPDLSVSCRPNPSTDTFQDAPIMIVEVLSESTRRVDEREKMEAYLSIDSLCIYILVEQSTAAAQLYRRVEDGFARESYVGLDTIIPIPEIDCQMSLAEVYDQVEFQPPETDETDDA